MKVLPLTKKENTHRVSYCSFCACNYFNRNFIWITAIYYFRGRMET